MLVANVRHDDAFLLVTLEVTDYVLPLLEVVCPLRIGEHSRIDVEHGQPGKVPLDADRFKLLEPLLEEKWPEDGAQERGALRRVLLWG